MLAAVAAIVAAPAEPVSAAQPQAQLEKEQARPQWVRAGNAEAARRLIGLLESSGLDGLNPKKFKIGSLKKAVRAAERGSPAAVARANAMLDGALISYVTALRRAPTSDWIINDQEALPPDVTAAQILAAASRSSSLEAWIRAMPFMHPSYAGLRGALARSEQQGDRRSADLLRVNLQRARLLPATGRYVLVNTAAQRLYMYEDGRIIDSMKVVVGKPHQPTPMMAATIKYTALNPYWNVPPDLAAERVAPNVVREGLRYLKTHGYVVLSDWTDNAKPVDPSTIDWEAVEAGRIQVRVRQNPGPGNAMGRMKFMFPNPQGIYLHDTPNKELLNEDARLFSGGCVRLEDAPRLARWLYGKPLDPRRARTEQPVKLAKPVPVYLIYQTAVPSDDEVVFYDDIYGKDQAMIAGAGKGRIAAR
ncbi:MAG TPA: L,D-transpeptidase family protein [Sphingomicrobium sp.]